MRLITDRTRENVVRLNTLSLISWDTMSASERAEWSGDPFVANNEGANLLPPSGAGVVFRDGSIDCEEFGSITIGSAADLSGATLTISAEYISPGGTISLAWSDGTEMGVVLSAAGYATVTLPSSTNTQLLMWTSAGYYAKVMVELGRVAHEYVPYSEIVPTNATKGAYNFSDMNRVERAVAEIAEILALSVVTKTDWNVWDIPTKSDLTRYLGNVRLLRDVCGISAELPEHLDKMTHTTANRIEEVLLLCRNIAESTIRCGELVCGEVY